MLWGGPQNREEVTFEVTLEGVRSRRGYGEA